MAESRRSLERRVVPTTERDVVADVRAARPDPYGELLELQGHHVLLETVEGLLRCGVLTSIRMRPMKISGVERLIPLEFVLDGDECDPLPLSQIIRIV